MITPQIAGTFTLCWGSRCRAPGSDLLLYAPPEPWRRRKPELPESDELRTWEVRLQHHGDVLARADSGERPCLAEAHAMTETATLEHERWTAADDIEPRASDRSRAERR